jgi:hypothetical protein
MTAYGGVEWRWVVIFTPLPLYPRGNSSRYPLDRRSGGPHSWSGRYGEIKILLQELELRPLGRPARSQSLYQLSYRGSWILLIVYSIYAGWWSHNKAGCRAHNILICVHCRLNPFVTNYVSIKNLKLNKDRLATNQWSCKAIPFYSLRHYFSYSVQLGVSIPPANREYIWATRYF